MDNELESLRLQLNSLKQEFAHKIKVIEDRMGAIQKQHREKINHDQQAFSSSVNQEKPAIHQQQQPVTTSVTNTAHDGWNTPGQPLINRISLRAIIGSYVVKLGLLELILSFFGPFASIVQKLSGVYKHYQSQGKAPVFFMTAAGISALILGFGYLLQYSFSEHLSEVGKVIVAYTVAIAVTIGGIRFTRKYSTMKEYGSSIIALGIILNYLCTYFSTDYYSIFPAGASLALLAVITVCAYVIALLFETRVVAIVSLIGGAFAPVLLGNITQPPTLYFSYLLLLVVFTLYLAQRIRWQTLAQTSMLLSVTLIQYCLLDFTATQQTSVWLVGLIHGFFYAFVYFAINDIGRSNSVPKTSLFIISASLLFLLVTLEQLIDNTHTYGLLLIGNTIAWLIFTVFPQQVFVTANTAVKDETRSSMRVLALLSAGVLAGIGILALTDPKFLGLVWGMESLLLLYMGSRFNYFSIRIEAYLVLVVALAQSSNDVLAWVADSIVAAPALLQLEFGLGWMNLIVATILVWTTVYILRKFDRQENNTDKKVYRFSNEFLSIYVSAAILFTIGIFLSQWMWAFAVVPLFYLIYRAKRHCLIFSEYFGFAHYLLLLIPIAVSAEQAGSFRFMQQSIVGQVVRVEAFVCLWGIAEFYNRFNPTGRLIRFARVLRQIFYCLIPIFFLPSVIRRHIEFLPLVIWGSSLISLFLYYKFKYKALRIETIALVVLSSMTAFIACAFVEFEHWEGYGISGLWLGVAFYGFVLWTWQGFRVRPIAEKTFLVIRQGVRPLFTLSLYYFGVVFFIMLYGFTHSPLLAASLACVYFTILLAKSPVVNPLRRNLKTMYLTTWAIIALTNASYYIVSVMQPRDIAIQSMAVIVVMSCAASLVYLRRRHLALVWKKLGGQLLHLWTFHLASIVTYVSLIENWFDRYVGPAVSIALVIHATIVLFQTLNTRFQRLVWLAGGLYAVTALKIIFYDMGDFSLVEKIIAFMFIGALLLTAAFQYQRMRRTA